jgi:hypothetical protein
MALPKDPILLLSVVNTLLRDHYASLEALCEDREADPASVRALLESAGYFYDAAHNQFR